MPGGLYVGHFYLIITLHRITMLHFQNSRVDYGVSLVELTATFVVDPEVELAN